MFVRAVGQNQWPDIVPTNSGPNAPQIIGYFNAQNGYPANGIGNRSDPSLYWIGVNAGPFNFKGRQISKIRVVYRYQATLNDFSVVSGSGYYDYTLNGTGKAYLYDIIPDNALIPRSPGDPYIWVLYANAAFGGWWAMTAEMRIGYIYDGQTDFITWYGQPCPPVYLTINSSFP